MYRSFFSILFLLGLTSLVQAQGLLGAEYRLTVQPAKEPVPALKYQLAFELRDQLPGNAAVHYFRAGLIEKDRFWRLPIEKRREEVKLRDKWLVTPLKEWPRAEVHAHFDQFKAVYDLIERAARSEQCRWEVVDVVQEDGYGSMETEFQEFRLFADLLRYKIRLELADGNIDKAAHWLRIGFTMCRQAADGPTVINVLIGLALTSMMDYELMQFIQQTGAPNMYWALTDLPRIDARKGFQGERLAVKYRFPGLREMATDLKAAPMTPAQVGELADRLVKLSRPTTTEAENAERLAILNMAGRLHEDAKKALAEEGRAAEDIEKMPSLQAALLLQLRQFDRGMDDLIKLLGVPFYDAGPRLKKLEERFNEENDKADGVGLTMARMVPGGYKVRTAQVRIERRLAGMRCVEAVRLYAGSHAGKPPAQLDDIKEVPIPLDPYTGKSFLYKADGKQAVIEGPAPEGKNPGPDNFIRYIVTIKK
jgi:hypothetical protein